MAYDRDDFRYRRSGRDRDFGRDTYGRDQFRGDNRDFDRGDDRGFFERAGDEIASWFGDDEAERRRRYDQRGEHSYGRDRYGYGDRSPQSRSRPEPNRSEGYFGASGFLSSTDDFGGRRPSTRYDEPRGFAGSRDFDPHYRSWRQQQIDALDRDYDEYRREHQSRFESDFGGWREKRMSKRSLLGTVREQMEVIGSDDEHVGTVDRVAGDRIILTKSDPESGGVHHSLSCSDIDRIEENRVILDCDADEAKRRWRDESRSRALFEREDQGEMGPRILDRSFEGTYR